MPELSSGSLAHICIEMFIIGDAPALGACGRFCRVRLRGSGSRDWMSSMCLRAGAFMVAGGDMCFCKLFLYEYPASWVCGRLFGQKLFILRANVCMCEDCA